ncbi:unnamed protein product [Pedinophyceae sp. YPF-701]|nr:unnamed protein product [Pedinophyceae sp. YPF-701]
MERANSARAGECDICLEQITAPGTVKAPMEIGPCQHVFCAPCVDALMQTRRGAREAAVCPTCRGPVHVELVLPGPTEGESGGGESSRDEGAGVARLVGQLRAATGDGQREELGNALASYLAGGFFQRQMMAADAGACSALAAALSASSSDAAICALGTAVDMLLAGDDSGAHARRNRALREGVHEAVAAALGATRSDNVRICLSGAAASLVHSAHGAVTVPRRQGGLFSFLICGGGGAPTDAESGMGEGAWRDGAVAAGMVQALHAAAATAATEPACAAAAAAIANVTARGGREGERRDAFNKIGTTEVLCKALLNCTTDSSRIAIGGALRNILGPAGKAGSRRDAAHRAQAQRAIRRQLRRSAGEPAWRALASAAQNLMHPGGARYERIEYGQEQELDMALEECLVRAVEKSTQRALGGGLVLMRMTGTVENEIERVRVRAIAQEERDARAQAQSAV